MSVTRRPSPEALLKWRSTRQVRLPPKRGWMPPAVGARVKPRNIRAAASTLTRHRQRAATSRHRTRAGASAACGLRAARPWAPTSEDDTCIIRSSLPPFLADANAGMEKIPRENEGKAEGNNSCGARLWRLPGAFGFETSPDLSSGDERRT